GFGWVVRANRFRNIQAAGQLAGPAVLISRGSANSVVEQNSFIDCQREIALGLEDRTPNDHSGGIVRNNFIARRAAIKGTTAILIADSPDTRVLHNTILANGTSKELIEYRFADSTGIIVRNNLLDGEIVSRDGASGSAANNYSKATARLFVQPASGNLHLVSAAPEVIDRVAVLPEAGSDFDGDTRPHGAAADYGADEARAGLPAPSARGSAEPMAEASRDPPLGAALPAPWKVADVGDPVSATTGRWWAGTFSVEGSGRDIGGHSDQFGFVYRLLEGDGEIVARVEGLDGSGAVKSGVMIREELTRGAKYAAALLTVDQRMLFQHRIANDAVTTQTASRVSVGPWVRLLRRGQTLSAYSSADGVRWVLTGSETVYMNRLVYVGLVVTGRSSPGMSRALFTRVSVSMSSTAAPNTAPIVSLTAPSFGAACQTPCAILLTAAASDPDGAVARVDFYAGQALIGSATRAPFSVTWREVPPGTHTLKAMAYDDVGAVTTSAGVVVTAKARSNQPPVVSIVAPAHGTTHIAPTNVNVIARASDADGTIARVEFFAGSTMIGIAESSPYSVTWRNAPVGTYTLSAKAWDNAGGSIISAGVNITIAPASPLPDGWQTMDVGQPILPGSVSHRSATFNVTAAGVDIGERSDQFRFVYQSLDGDGEISACVVSLDYVNSWSKAGVMVRESLAVDSRYAFSLLSAGWGAAFHYRSEAGAASAQAG
ncbi:MAG TPA: Ig-like domain-containing protein, partial [Gemmatimonadaceae bacterium]